MFHSKKADPSAVQGPIDILGKETKIEGALESKGNIRIDGTINGELKAEGKLMIASTGSVNGDIHCHDAEIAGIVKGNIYSSGLLKLAETAKIVGEIKFNKLDVDPGAVMDCSCSMINKDSENLTVVPKGESVAV